MQETKRAIEFLEREGLVRGGVRIRNGKVYYNENINTILRILKSELDRQENKPLTLRKLKEMVGEPVWDDFYQNWDILLGCSEDVDSDGDYTVELSDGEVYYTINRFYKHKPNQRCNNEN